VTPKKTFSEYTTFEESSVDRTR